VLTALLLAADANCSGALVLLLSLVGGLGLLTGYVRVVLSVLAFSKYWDYTRFTALYLVGFLLDAADGYAARFLNQRTFAASPIPLCALGSISFPLLCVCWTVCFRRAIFKRGPAAAVSAAAAALRDLPLTSYRGALLLRSCAACVSVPLIAHLDSRNSSDVWDVWGQLSSDEHCLWTMVLP